jgi:3-hydroxybutyryl-CoA dehydrogenase
MERMLVIGAGTMGRGIAHVGALAGFEVSIFDAKAEQVATALDTIRANLQKGVDRGKLSVEDMQAAAARLSATSDMEASAKEADVVIEAVYEDMELKQTLVRALDAVMKPEALLGSNTSSLSLSAIAAAAAHPERVIGMHFINPVHIMKLLEIVRAEQTSDETLERTLALSERLGKTAIVVRDVPGFATSRLGVILGLEAIRMVEQEVASPADIDTALELGYRHPMGPLKLSDLVGLDVRLAIADHLHRELGGDQYKAPELMRRMVAEGKTGKKSGEGFYRWVDGKPVPKT